jgi:hypothetical protein
MDEISKDDFLENFKDEFSGDDKSGYDYKGFFIEESNLASATNHIASSLDEIDAILENKENDAEGEDSYTELNNAIMAHIFGDGDDFQGSYEEELESGDYDWYLDFGDIEVDRNKGGINYTGVRFYKG